jgi:hypothetical protein
MHGVAVARNRKRKVPNWGPIFGLLILLNVGFGLKYSKIFAPSLIRVEGVPEDDQERVRNAVMLLQNQPALNANKLKIQEEIMRRPDVLSASVELNLAKRGLVKVSYDFPVAYFLSKPNLGLTVSGRLTPVQDTDGLVPLRVYSRALEPAATFANGWEMRSVAKACQLAREADIPKLTVDFAENGELRLNSGNEARIVMGAAIELERKFQRLAQIRASDPGLLTDRNELVLIAPDKPSIRKMEGNL